MTHIFLILAGLLVYGVACFGVGYLVRRRHPTDPSVGPVKL